MAAELGGSPNALLYGGRWLEYVNAQPVTEAPYFSFQRAYAQYRAGQSAAAFAVLEPMIERSPSALYARYGAALLAIIQNRNASATAILQGIIEQRDGIGHADGEVAYREAVLLRLAELDDLAFERLHKAVAQGFVCPACVARDPLWQALENDPRMIAWRLEASRTQP